MKFLVTTILLFSVQTLSAQLENNNDSVDINKLYKNLPEVVVKAEKPIVKIVQKKNGVQYAKSTRKITCR